MNAQSVRMLIEPFVLKWSLSLSDASQRGKQGHRCRYLNMQNDFTVQIHGEQRPLVATFEFTQG